MRNKLIALFIFVLKLCQTSYSQEYIRVFDVSGEKVLTLDSIPVKNLQRFDLTDKNMLYIDSQGVYYEYDLTSKMLVNSAVIRDDFKRKPINKKIDEVCYINNKDNDFFIAYEDGWQYQYFRKVERAFLKQRINDAYYKIKINSKKDYYFFSARFRYDYGGRLSINHISYWSDKKKHGGMTNVNRALPSNEVTALSEFNSYQVLNFDISPKDDKYAFQLHNNHLVTRRNDNSLRQEYDCDPPIQDFKFMDEDTLLVGDRYGSVMAGNTDSVLNFMSSIVDTGDSLLYLNVYRPERNFLLTFTNYLALYHLVGSTLPAQLLDRVSFEDKVISVKQSYSEKTIGILFKK